MNFIFLFQRLRWVYLPASLLSVILQRAPLVRLLATAESTLGGGVSALLRSAFTVAAVGGYHALAGATQLSTSPATPASATVGQSFSLAFALTGAPSAARSYEIKGTLPPGLSVPGMVGDLLNASTGTITGTPTTAGSYSLSIRAWSSTNKRGDGGTPTFTVQINVQGGAVAPPTFSAHPASASVNVGANVNFTAAATGGTITYQWRKDGAALAGATAATLGLTNVSVASAGSYDVVATNAGGSTTSNAATLTVTQPAIAPSITTQPVNATATVGGTVSFSAAASGTAPITYQWTKDGAAVPGATAATVTLNAVTLASAGSYQLTATNAAGSAQSTVVTLTVTEPAVAPSITTQPVNATATVGGTVTFSAAASGTAPITYQWTKDGATVAGATAATLTLNAVTLASAGSYQLTATNAAGSVQSAVATLTVTEPAVAPSITTQPVNATATVGGTVTFSAAASGTAPITYQWTKDGAPIAGATSTTLTLNAVTLASAGSYRLSATNTAGTAQSNPASLTVNEAVVAPSMTTQPVNATATVGGTVTFSAAANGTAPITYQWTKDGAPIAGATSSTLTLNAVTLASAGSYRLSATNAAGTAQSNPASLTVTEATVAPSFTTQPANATATVGGTVTFSAAANGTAPITYQWTKDGAPIAGAMSTTLTLNAVTLASAGSYRLSATNAAGTAQSNPASLTVTEATVAPSFTTQPANATATVGGTVTFSAAANGTAPITYQWTKDGAPIAGATSTTLTLNAVTLASAGSYRLSAMNAAGTAQSNPASLTVTEATVAPSFTTQPANATATVGGTVTFSAAANGTAPITYQWTKDGAPIAGATSTTLTLNAVTLASAGSYRLSATNAAGTAQSNPASLTVTEAVVAPQFTSQPVSVTVAVGGAASFSALVSGSGPLTYQWFKDGSVLPGATSSTLTLPVVTEASAGSYRLVATNPAGSAQSSAASLTLSTGQAAPSVSVVPMSQTAQPNDTVTLTAVATGTGPLSYQWTRNGSAIPGATGSVLVMTGVDETAGGAYRVIVHNELGSIHSHVAHVQVTPAVGPSILVQPLGQSVVQGASVTLAVEATGPGSLSYQWHKGGLALPGANAAQLALTGVQLSDAGDYTVTVSNSSGSVVSAVATLAVTQGVASAITNVSVVTNLAAEQLLVVGFNVSGGDKSFLLRAVGPGLDAFGVPQTMPDPEIVLYQGGTRLDWNDNWGGERSMVELSASVGAFGLAPNSLDAALVSSVGGGRTAQIHGRIGGRVLVEVYDAGRGMTQRLTNISARNRVGSGADVLIAGFTISGRAAKTVLIRAIGPSLGQFGVPAVLDDPKLEVYAGSTRLAENDSWSPSLAPLFARVGAFGLPEGSRDAATVLSLPPGGYTVQVSGVAGAVGEALIEVFEVQP